MTKLPPIALARRRGLTLVEILVSMAAMSILIGAVVATFIAIVRSTTESEARIAASTNGRSALGSMSKEIKGASLRFQGANRPLSFGDAMDDDVDGEIDEEQPNGLDEDGDWVDQHALTTGTLAERGNWIGRVDLGDVGVDEDCLFHNDKLLFRLFPADNETYLFDEILYEVGSFEGRERVLLRTAVRLMTDGSITSRTAPLAYDVLSFNCLYWNPNAFPADQYWMESWDSLNPPGPGPFATFVEPAAVLVSVTVYADPRPIESYLPGQSVQVLTHRTIVNIEKVIQDAKFPRNPVGVP